jgi:hypothetical protein
VRGDQLPAAVAQQEVVVPAASGRPRTGWRSGGRLASGFKADAEGCLDRLHAPGGSFDEVLVGVVTVDEHLACAAELRGNLCRSKIGLVS